MRLKRTWPLDAWLDARGGPNTGKTVGPLAPGWKLSGGSDMATAKTLSPWPLAGDVRWLEHLCRRNGP
eukprot:6646929-Lingulodinium_polyedra.AAC.1